MSLPTNLLPEKDLMSKRIIQDPKVINYFTEAFAGTKDDYLVGNCEWRNGTRSDIVLEPKSSVDLPPIIVEIQYNINNNFLKRAVGYCLQASSRFGVDPLLLIIVLEPKSSVDLPPIIVEIQYNINNNFLKRAVGYCLQASSRFGVDPLLLIICVGKLNQEIQDDVKDSRLTGIYSYFCKPWDAECLIICQDSLAQNPTTPLNLLVALGLFLSNPSISLIDHPYSSDSTIQYLHILVLHFHQIDFQNITKLLLKLINSQIAEYGKYAKPATTSKSSK